MEQSKKFSLRLMKNTWRRGTFREVALVFHSKVACLLELERSSRWFIFLAPKFGPTDIYFFITEGNRGFIHEKSIHETRITFIHTPQSNSLDFFPPASAFAPQPILLPRAVVVVVLQGANKSSPSASSSSIHPCIAVHLRSWAKSMSIAPMNQDPVSPGQRSPSKKWLHQLERTCTERQKSRVLLFFISFLEHWTEALFALVILLTSDTNCDWLIDFGKRNVKRKAKVSCA